MRTVGERTRRRRSVRFRTTLAAVLVVAVALIAAGLALVVGVDRSLSRSVRTTAEQQADDIVAGLEAGGRPTDLGADPDDEDDEEDEFFQVIDSNGDVVAASPTLAGQLPVADLGPEESDEVSVSAVDEDPFLVVAAEAVTGDETFVVLVGRSIDDVNETVLLLARSLLLGIPLLVLVVGVTTWILVGRALAPVEAMRREVDAISATELHRRVPQPPSDDEIARLASTMNRMLDRLEASAARQQRFVSDASHELRSPVAAIRQYAEVALAHPESMSSTELAENVLAEDLRVQRLVDDLLLLARADESMLALRAAPVDIDDLVLDEAQRLRDTTALRIDTSGVTAGRVEGDESSLRRVLRNLGENAARHARHAVAFGLTLGDGALVVTVDDDGPGVAPEDRERVFDRFVRLDDSRTREDGGSGLGLAIVTELVRAHRGTVVMGESKLGGVRVEVRLRTSASDQDVTRTLTS